MPHMLREKILAHDILIFGGPIWMGQISSVAKWVMERMDAFSRRSGSDAELWQGRGRSHRRRVVRVKRAVGRGHGDRGVRTVLLRQRRGGAGRHGEDDTAA